MTPDRLLNEFAVGSGANPFAIAAGFHDDLWFTVRATGQTSGRIGRVTLDGTVTLFPLPTGGDPYAITRGPDAAMWFTFYDGGVGRISTAGDITEFFSGQCLGGHSIVTGPDGALWVASMYSLGRITTMGESNCVIWDMAPDLFGPLFTDASGGLWMSGNDLMLRRLVIQPSVAGVVVKTQQVGIGPAPRSGLMTQTVDGNLWFAVDDNGTSVPQKIGRMPVPPSSTGWTKGDVTLFDVPGAAWITAIAAGPDANIWFTLSNNRIGRMTPTGELTYWSARTPQGIAAGPDGNIWFTEGWHYTYPDGEGDKVARLDLDEL